MSPVAGAAAPADSNVGAPWSPERPPRPEVREGTGPATGAAAPTDSDVPGLVTCAVRRAPPPPVGGGGGPAVLVRPNNRVRSRARITGPTARTSAGVFTGATEDTLRWTTAAGPVSAPAGVCRPSAVARGSPRAPRTNGISCNAVASSPASSVDQLHLRWRRMYGNHSSARGTEVGNEDVTADPTVDTAPTERRAINDRPVSRPKRAIFWASIPTCGHADTAASEPRCGPRNRNRSATARPRSFARSGSAVSVTSPDPSA